MDQVPAPFTALTPQPAAVQASSQMPLLAPPHFPTPPTPAPQQAINEFSHAQPPGLLPDAASLLSTNSPLTRKSTQPGEPTIFAMCQHMGLWYSLETICNSGDIHKTIPMCRASSSCLAQLTANAEHCRDPGSRSNTRCSGGGKPRDLRQGAGMCAHRSCKMYLAYETIKVLLKTEGHTDIIPSMSRQVCIEF